MQSLRVFLDNLSPAQLADRLDLAMEGASLGIWDWDLRDNSVQFDRRWCEMLGLDHATMPMELSSWESRVHPDDIAGCYADIQAYLAGETEYYENIHRMRHADGRWVYILDRGRVSGWDATGKAIRFTGTHFDCTATERARRLIEAQEAMLRSLVRGLPTAACLVDGEGKLLAASDEWRTWFVAHGAEGAQESPLVAPAPPGWTAALADTLAGAVFKDVEVRVMSARTGHERVLRWSMRPWGEGTHVARGAVIRFDDITLELERRAKAAQTERLSDLGRVAGGIAHELNTPLQTLVLDAGVVVEELESDATDSALLQELGREILQTANYLSEVVGAMRTLSREPSRDPLQQVSVVQSLSQARRMCETRLRERGVTLTLEKAHPSWTVQARPSQLLQILTNLVSNAADAARSESGGWVRLSARRFDGATELVVVDSGPGVPEELRQAIMTPFFTTKAPGEGTGIGLSMSLSLSEAMGATLRLVPEAKHTTFVLRFPDTDPT